MSAKRIAVFPGSFNPFTHGHLYIAEQASRMFDSVIIMVGVNPEKTYRKEPEFMNILDRIERIEKLTSHLPNISVKAHDGMTCDFCNQHDAKYIVRGIRNTNDVNHEETLWNYNMEHGNIQTILFPAPTELKDISSTLVRYQMMPTTFMSYVSAYKNFTAHEGGLHSTLWMEKFRIILCIHKHYIEDNIFDFNKIAVIVEILEKTFREYAGYVSEYKEYLKSFGDKLPDMSEPKNVNLKKKIAEFIEWSGSRLDSHCQKIGEKFSDGNRLLTANGEMDWFVNGFLSDIFYPSEYSGEYSDAFLYQCVDMDDSFLASKINESTMEKTKNGIVSIGRAKDDDDTYVFVAEWNDSLNNSHKTSYNSHE